MDVRERGLAIRVSLLVVAAFLLQATLAVGPTRSVPSSENPNASAQGPLTVVSSPNLPTRAAPYEPNPSGSTNVERPVLHALEVGRLADINADHREDYLVLSMDTPDAYRLRVASGGAAPEKVLWDLPIPSNQWRLFGDFTGDGLPDLLIETDQVPAVQTTGQSAGIARVASINETAPVEYEIRDGRTGATALDLSSADFVEQAGGSAGASGAGTEAQRHTSTQIDLEPVSQVGMGGLFVVQRDVRAWGLATASPAASNARMSSVTAILVTKYDRNGTASWTVRTTPSDNTTWALMAQDVTGDHGADLVFFGDETVGTGPIGADPAAGPSFHRVHVNVVDGTTGHQLWTWMGPPFTGFATVRVIGDVNGEGARDVAVCGFFSSDPTRPAMGTRLVQLEGRSGSILRDETLADRVRIPEPLGNRGDRSGEETLWLDARVESDSTRATLSWSDAKILAVDSVGTTVWSLPLGMPIPPGSSPAGLHLFASPPMEDFDGDGHTDFLLHGLYYDAVSSSAEEPILLQSGPLEVVSGATGKVLFSQSLPDRVQVLPVRNGPGSAWNLVTVARAVGGSTRALAEVAGHRGSDFQETWRFNLTQETARKDHVVVKVANLGRATETDADDVALLATYVGETNGIPEVQGTRITTVSATTGQVVWSFVDDAGRTLGLDAPPRPSDIRVHRALPGFEPALPVMAIVVVACIMGRWRS